MPSLGSVHAAFATALQETSVGLANINFDFSLLKVEAPAEYRELGASLSAKRRDAAEHGATHITARKLGLLFEEILPSTPSLFKAYGLRACEIATSPSINPRGSNDHGPFAEYIGVDGTSIWAAATSGKGAVAIHLLACMLARIWTPSEAVAIWEQILEERKTELSTFDETEAIPLRSLATSQITLSREQLAEWDANARAWLRAADIAKGRNQKQVMLILDNLNLPVNGDMNVYSSVIRAWQMAMVTIDKLIDGVSHSVHNGAVLLGLSAWHLYPDFIVLGKETASTSQKDPLIAPGSTVTLGLQGVEPENSRGVYWSLPLAHVRFYGEPTASEGSVTSGSTRISMDDIFVVALGSLSSLWGNEGSQAVHVANVVCQLWESCLKGLKERQNRQSRGEIVKTSWLKLLNDAATRLLESSGPEKESCKRLFGLGQRRSTLLGRFQRTIPIFGLTDATFVNILTEDGRVAFLRSIAYKCSAETDVLIIKTRVQRTVYEGEGAKRQKIRVYFSPELASVPSRSPTSAMKRWVVPFLQGKNSKFSTIQDRTDEIPETECREEFLVLYEDSIELIKDGLWFRWVDPAAMYTDSSTSTDPKKPRTKVKPNTARWNPFSNAETPQPPRKGPVATFAFLYGDVKTAALYRRVNIEGASFRRLDNNDLGPQGGNITREEITNALTAGSVDTGQLVEHLKGVDVCSQRDLEDQFHTPVDSPFRGHVSVIEAFQALATASKVYSFLPSATVSLNTVTYGPLSHSYWFKECKSSCSQTQVEDPVTNMLLPHCPSRKATFACISMLESGSFDLRPDNLERVMAISSGDSIYVAAPVLCDPAVRPMPYETRRIIGNIGRAGLAFMIPPTNPRTKRLDLEFYQVINHDPYDGKLEDCFKSTTLHLGFSGYEFPLEVGHHGGRNREAFFVETLVSLHDRGEWIADLDTLATSASPLLHCSSHLDQTSCGCGSYVASDYHQLPDFPLVAIDRWEELLEKPLDAAVVRAHGNWLARLAATAMSVRMGHHTVILSGIGCRECGGTTLTSVPQNNRLEGGSRGEYINEPKTIYIL